MPDRLALPARPALPAVPLIRATEIRPFVAWLEAEGIPKHGFLARAGLPDDPTDAPYQFVAGLPFRAFLDDVTRREGGPDLGWRVAAGTEATALDAFVRVLPRARALGEAIRSFCRELLWNSPTADFGICEADRGAWFWRRSTRGVEASRDVMEQYVAMMMVRMVRAVAGPGWSPALLKLEMRHIDPTGREMLGDPQIELGASFTALHLTPTLLALPVEARAGLADAGTPAREGPGLATDLVGALRQALPAALPWSPGIDWGAEAAGRSRRTLQRRLAEHGVTWDGLLAEVRREVACRELADEAAPVREVARRAGYRDPANFTRAFRRWTGATPQAFRERSQTDRAAPLR